MRSISRTVPLTTTGLALAALVLAGCGGGSSGHSTGTSGGTAAPLPSASRGASQGASAAGNGVSKESASDIADDASLAADGSKSVHVTGTIHDSGQTVGLNMRVARSGVAYGTVTYAGAPLQLVASGTTVWMRSTAAGWQKFMAANGTPQEGSTVARLVGSRWITGARSSSVFQPFNDFIVEQELLDNLVPGGDDLPGLTKGDAASEGTVPVQVLTASDGTRYEVATTGKPYPMALRGTDSTGSGGDLHFDSWDAAVRTAVPTAADAIDLSRVTGF